MLTIEDLYVNQYDFETLKQYIYCVPMLDILKTQKLTAGFCVKYILNPNFQLSETDEQITLQLVKELQPHIGDREWVEAQVEAEKKRRVKQRVDSIEDFESYANRH
jgi:hypothetical protein